MNFEKLKIEHVKVFNALLEKHHQIFSDEEGSELCFANLYAWSIDDDINISYTDNYLIIQGIYKGKIYFIPPLATSIKYFEQAIMDLKEYCKQNKIFLILYETNNEAKKDLKYLLDKHELISYENRDLAEYIYLVSDLKELSGKKYHAKRNFIARFQSNYSYSYREYTDNDYNELISNLCAWDKKRFDDNEIEAITMTLQNLKLLNANCDVLIIDNKIEGFTVFSKSLTNKDLVYVLFEKGNNQFEGIFPMINYLCANKNYNDVLYCNRQEDMGILNLRKSKLSYHPDHLAMKYSLVDSHLITELKDLYIEAFPEDKGDYANYFFNNINYHQIEYLEENNHVISSLYIIPKELKFFNASFYCPLIVGVCTKREFQHCGKCSLLMRKAVINLYKQSTSLVYLYPVDHEFYKQYGFTLMNYLNSDDKVIKEIDINQAKEIYDEISNNNPIYLLRNDEDWKNLQEKIETYHGKIFLTENGYKIISNDEETNQEIIEECLSIDNPTEEGMMVRILDIKTILANYNFGEVQKSFKVKIIDSKLPKNNISIQINISNELVKINDIKTEDFDCVVSIEELTKAIFLGYNKNDNEFLNLFKKIRVINQDKY